MRGRLRVVSLAAGREVGLRRVGSGAVQDVRLTDLLVAEHADEDLAAADRDLIRHLSVRSRLQPDVPLARVDALVKAPFDFADGDAESADQHGDGGVRDVVRHAGETEHH